MRTVYSWRSMQRLARQWRREGRRVGFVPTMGFLHEGHLSLMRRARQLVGSRGCVVVSIYVNPTQFGPHEDLSRYPRDLAGDTARCRSAGVDVLFVPDDRQMYPGKADGLYSTYVQEVVLARHMEGGSRPTHFQGVTTIVAKLFNIVLPDVAVFGAKDYQQAAIIRRMATDLHFPLRVVVAPTVREPDGLAMSSRNKYLTPAQRKVATVLHESLGWVRQKVRERDRCQAVRLRRELTAQINAQAECRLDYVEYFHPDTLEPVAEVTRGTHMALAVWVGSTRLIDNARL